MPRRSLRAVPSLLALVVITSLGLGWVALAAPLPVAAAAEVVGSGTPGSCTAAALEAALIGGGSITFSCGLSLIHI